MDRREFLVTTTGAARAAFRKAKGRDPREIADPAHDQE